MATVLLIIATVVVALLVFTGLLVFLASRQVGREGGRASDGHTGSAGYVGPVTVDSDDRGGYCSSDAGGDGGGDGGCGGGD